MSRPRCGSSFGCLPCELREGHAEDHASTKFGSRRAWTDEQAARHQAETDEQLAKYAKLIEERWRALSDGERVTLMTQCCPRCGALKENGVVTRRPRDTPCCL